MVTPSVKIQSQEVSPFPCPREIAKPFIEMKKGCCSEGLQAFLLCLFLLNTPKKEAAWIVLIFRSAAVVGVVKQLFEALGEALKKIYLCHQLFLKENKVCKKCGHTDKQEAAGDWPKEISAATKVWLCGEGWWGCSTMEGWNKSWSQVSDSDLQLRWSRQRKAHQIVQLVFSDRSVEESGHNCYWSQKALTQWCKQV